MYNEKSLKQGGCYHMTKINPAFNMMAYSTSLQTNQGVSTRIYWGTSDSG